MNVRTIFQAENEEASNNFTGLMKKIFIGEHLPSNFSNNIRAMFQGCELKSKRAFCVTKENKRKFKKV